MNQIVLKKFAVSLFFCSLAILINAQPLKKDDKNLDFGIKFGTVYTKISDISQTLVSESYYTGYSFKNDFTLGFTGSIYINYKLEESISAIYSEISYCRLGNKVHYSDINNLNYDFTSKYDYINWELFYKAYVFKGLHLDIGGRLGFNLTPSNIFYTSNGEDRFGPDIRIQQQMRDVLKGRANFSAAVGIGYEFDFGLNFDLRYYNGFSDVMETEVNNYHFIENKNMSRSFQFTMGYTLPYLFNFH
jgi:hypothetical protein